MFTIDRSDLPTSIEHLRLEAAMGMCEAPPEFPALALQFWLDLEYSAQVREVRAFLDRRMEGTSNWLDVFQYQMLMPGLVPDIDQRLFLHIMEAALAVVRHLGCVAGRSSVLVEEMLSVAQARDGHVQIAIKCLTGVLGASAGYLGSIFRSRTGVGFRRYLRLLRVRRVCLLLRHSSVTLDTIAMSVGHSDTRHLVREFRCEMGLGPGKYRRVAEVEWRVPEDASGCLASRTECLS